MFNIETKILKSRRFFQFLFLFSGNTELNRYRLHNIKQQQGRRCKGFMNFVYITVNRLPPEIEQMRLTSML